MPAPPRMEDLFTDLSRRNTDMVAEMVLQKPALFENLFSIFLRNEEPVSRRAAWVVDLVSEQRPDLLEPHLTEIIDHLHEWRHDGMKRHSVRMLSRSPLPEGDHLGLLMSTCFDWLLSPRESIATKVFSMDILYRMSEAEPALKKELADTIEWRLEEESPGLQNKGRKLLQKLYREMETSSGQ